MQITNNATLIIFGLLEAKSRHLKRAYVKFLRESQLAYFAQHLTRGFVKLTSFGDGADLVEVTIARLH